MLKNKVFIDWFSNSLVIWSLIDYSYSKEVNTQPFFFFLLILFYLKADLPPLEGDADYEEDGGGVAEVAAGLQDGEHQPAGGEGYL